MHPIGDGAIVEQGSKHMLDRRHDGIDATYVKEGLLLTGKGGVRHILGGGGGAHCKRSLDTGTQLLISHPDRLLQLGLERGIDHPVADLLPGQVEGGDIVHVQIVEQMVDLAVEAA